ncbi:hypothetical protein D9758_018419, partial [Tetrapyrgos nigripes]
MMNDTQYTNLPSNLSLVLVVKGQGTLPPILYTPAVPSTDHLSHLPTKPIDGKITPSTESGGEFKDADTQLTTKHTLPG